MAVWGSESSQTTFFALFASLLWFASAPNEYVHVTCIICIVCLMYNMCLFCMID